METTSLAYYLLKAHIQYFKENYIISFNGICNSVAMRLDILMISKLVGQDSSGIYSSASRLIIIVLCLEHIFNLYTQI